MKVAIIGCGYIGLDVARTWTQRGFHVTATTRTPERLIELSKWSQKSLIFKNGNDDALIPLIADSEVILISIAADAPDHYESAYLEVAHTFRKLALEMNIPRDLIYISSTSVYGDHQGRWVDETSDLLGKSDQAQILIETERLYLSLSEIGWNPTIFRFSEIYGPGRELSKKVRNLKGHPLPGMGDHYTNMIHKQDCVAAIDYAQRHHLSGVYNLSDDDHMPRKELYNQVSHQYGLPRVEWDPSISSIHGGNKRVSNHKIKQEGFAFHHPHRVLD